MDNHLLNNSYTNFSFRLSGNKKVLNKIKACFISPVCERGHSLSAAMMKQYNLYRPAGPRKLMCYVPFLNLSFSPNGRILSCNYNQHILLGTFPKQSVKEAWSSKELKVLQNHHRNNNLDHGCSYCRDFLISKKFSGLKPLNYDKYSNEKSFNFPKVLEFELSNTCNLECYMCNGSASSAIRKNREHLPQADNPYDDTFVEQIKELIPHIKEAKFYGGEPFLIDIYYRIWDLIIDINPEIKVFIITNGTILNDKIKILLNKGKFELAVSVDAIQKDLFEKIRVNAHFETVMQNLTWFNDYCKKNKSPLTVSMTLTRENWDQVPEMIEFCNKIQAQIFLSYLQKPEKLALWNLPAFETEKIIKHLEDSTIIKYNDRISKYNYSCYHDFINHLNYWKNSVVKEPYDAVKNYKEEFRVRLDQHFSLSPSAGMSSEEAITKLEGLFNDFSTVTDKNKLYSELNKVPLSSLLFYLSDKNENIRELVKKWVEETVDE